MGTAWERHGMCESALKECVDAKQEVHYVPVFPAVPASLLSTQLRQFVNTALHATHCDIATLQRERWQTHISFSLVTET
jgi:hypothetical protein